MHADQELPAFLELESAIKTHRHNHECDGADGMKNCEVIADSVSKTRLELGLRLSRRCERANDLDC